MAYPFEAVVDPTGARDSFAGGFLGYLASHDGEVTDDVLRTATAYGAVLASFSVEEIGSARIWRLTPEEIDERIEVLRQMTRFESLPFVASPAAGL